MVPSSARSIYGGPPRFSAQATATFQCNSGACVDGMLIGAFHCHEPTHTHQQLAWANPSSSTHAA
eukprot:6422473-Amphidinium_carterae.1